MIKIFRSKETMKLFTRRQFARYPTDIQRIALRRLLLLDAAERIDDLNVSPGNRLEKLTGSRQGQHSIRVNDQSRICFKWSNGDAYEVELVEYH